MLAEDVGYFLSFLKGNEDEKKYNLTADIWQYIKKQFHKDYICGLSKFISNQNRIMAHQRWQNTLAEKIKLSAKELLKNIAET